MQIVNLNSKPKNKNVTVCLSYENIRDIANGLYEASKVNPKYEPIHRIMVDIFSLTKEGTINSWWKDDADGNS